MALRRSPPRRNGRHARRPGERGDEPGRLGLFERLLLAAVSLAFIGVFSITYMYTERTRPRSLASNGEAWSRPGDALNDPTSETGAGEMPPALATAPVLRATADASSSTFTICRTGGGSNCVVDGDTAWIGGEKIRIADIDAPETHPPRCAYEADLGEKATKRLAELVNAGPFDLKILDRDTDRYGRKLRILVRDGRSLGDQLVAEGLARTWDGRRHPWC